MADIPTLDPGSVNDAILPPSTDLTIGYLARIFGENWQHYIIGGGTPEGSASVLFHLTGVFNSVVLFGVAAMIVYISMIGVVGTAHEGTPLGKQYSTLWTPIRSAFAVFLLAPLPGGGGMSIVQAVVLAMVYFSIGGADMMQREAVQYMANNAGSITQVEPSDDEVNLAKHLLVISMAQNYYVHMRGQSVMQPYTSTWVSDDSGVRGLSSAIFPQFNEQRAARDSGKWVIRFGEPTPQYAVLPEDGSWFDMSLMDSGIRGHDMGKIIIACQNKADAICQARVNAVQTLAQSVYPIGALFVTSYKNGAPIDLTAHAVLPFRQAINTYTAQMRQAAINELNGGDSQYRVNLQRYATRAQELGWVTLGAHYWTIANFNHEAMEKVKQGPSYELPKIDKLVSSNFSDLKDIFLQLQAFEAKYRVSAEDQNLARGPHISDGGTWDNFTEWMSKPHTVIAASKWLTEGEPVQKLQSLGHIMIDVGYVMYGAAIVGDAAAGLINKSPLGAAVDAATDNKSTAAATEGKSESKGRGVINRLVGSITGFLKSVAIPLFILGLVFAFYLPSLPFIFWIMAVIGWFIQVFEAFVAAPLWAAAHAVPEGEGVAGQHGKQGYMLFLAILMKPALMVFGFFLSYELIIIVGKLIGDLFGIYATGLQAGSASGPVSMIALLAILLALIVIAGHKVFGLITWLPDNALRWVGQMVQNMGEGEAEGRTRAAFGAVFNHTSTGVAGGGKALEAINKAGKVGMDGGRGGEASKKALGADLEVGSAHASIGDKKV